MTTIKNIAKNTSVLFITQILVYVIGFIITMYTARYLGTEGFGIISLALSITALVGVFADLGLMSLMIREVARNKSLRDKYVSNTALMKVLLSFLTFGIIVVLVNLLGYSELVKIVVYIITLSVIINAFIGIFNAVFQAYEKMEYVSLGSISNSIIMLLGTAVGIHFQLDILFFASIYVIAGAVNFIFILVMYLWKYSQSKFDLDLSFWKPTLKEALFFGVTGIFVSIYFYIGSIVLSVLAGESAVGIYNAAWKLIFVLLFIPNVVIMALFPVMSQHFESSKELLKLEYEKTFKYLLIIATFIVMYGFVFADKIILIIYGSGYLDAIITLQTLIFVVPIIFLSSLSSNLLNAINKQRLVTLITAIMAIFNVILNVLLIREFSFIGAAVVTILTEALGFVLIFGYIHKYFLKIQITSTILKAIFSGFIVALIMYCLILVNVNWIIVSIIGVLLYLIALFLLKMINNDDLEILKKIFQE